MLLTVSMMEEGLLLELMIWIEAQVMYGCNKVFWKTKSS